MKPWLLFLLVPCLLFLKEHHHGIASKLQYGYTGSQASTAAGNSSIVPDETINTGDEPVLSLLDEDDDDDNESCGEKKKTGSTNSGFLPAINFSRPQQCLSFNPCKRLYKHYSYLSPGIYIYIFNREIII